MNIDRVSGSISLKKKVAIIAGAASGIGFAAAKRLAEMGAITNLLDIDESEGKKAAREIGYLKGNVKFYKCDVTSNSCCKEVAQSV